MQTSLLQDRVDAAWPHISEVVNTALKFQTGTLIRDVIPVSGSDSRHGTWGTWTVTAPTRRRVATNPPEAVASEHRFAIDYDILESPPLDLISTWATNARTLELTDLLGRIAARANAVQLNTPLPPQAVPAGWGQPRFVHWGLPAADVVLLAAVAQEKRLTIPLAGNVRA